jgi:galactokinase
LSTIERAIDAYAARFGAKPAAAALAPGRVEIMGNHTDYNGGYVIPAALDKVTAVVGQAVGGNQVTLYAVDLDRQATFDLRSLQPSSENSWANYLLGVVTQLQNAGVAVEGFQALIHSDVPTGAGLSSSAALEVSTALLLKGLFPYDLSKMDLARLCQKAENEFVGVPCGIMDQFASVFGEDGSLLFLDCLTMEHDVMKIGRDDLAIVVCDSHVEHKLTGGDYATRRGECEAAAAYFGKSILRDVTWDEFVAHEAELPENQRKRARHILTENARVLSLRQAIQGTDTTAIGRLFAEGHASSRDLFENSTPEIDFLADTAMGLPGCIGAKMFGGGWGGCTVNLVELAAVEDFSRALVERYKERIGVDASIYPFKASQGARQVEVA